MAKRILCTKNYGLFTRSIENRPLKLGRRKALRDSMREYGFLEDFHIVCRDIGGGKLEILDGQNRHAIAQELGLHVYYTIRTSTEAGFDIAKINGTPLTWSPSDYAHKNSSNNIPDYYECIQFADAHGMSVGVAAAMLAGTTTYNNVESAFRAGTWRITDREWANRVASLNTELKSISTYRHSTKLLWPCMCLCRIPGFDSERLIRCAKLCRDRLIPYSTRDQYLKMLEEVYNYHQSNKIPLEFMAKQVMRERSVALKEV